MFEQGLCLSTFSLIRSVMEPIVASGAYGVEPLGGEPAKASTPSPAVMEPVVASGAYGVEPLGGEPAKGSTPFPAVMATVIPGSFGGLKFWTLTTKNVPYPS